ncbi:MAG: AarF/UbiB family protein, partial [Chloroflexota bacterium]
TREARKSRNDYFRAPNLHTDYCRVNIIVQEFVEGVWLGDILNAVESRNDEMLWHLEQLHIDPDTVARRILWVNYWSMFENLFFHADPHPGNIVVQPGNKIVFIDFGACGSINSPHKMLYQKLFDSQSRDDPWQMAQAALGLLEPLNGVDINTLAKELEREFYFNLLAFKSEQSYWYERTTANVWISFLTLIRQYNIAPPRNILLFARSRFLYDTLTARLVPDLDFWDEFQDYYAEVNDKDRRKITRDMRHRIENGLLDKDYSIIKNTMDIGGLLAYRVQRLLLAPYDFVQLPYLIDKVSYIIISLVTFIAWAALIYGVGIVIGVIAGLLRDVPLVLEAVLLAPLTHPLYLGIVGVMFVLTLRRMGYRMAYRVRHQY